MSWTGILGKSFKGNRRNKERRIWDQMIDDKRKKKEKKRWNK